MLNEVSLVGVVENMSELYTLPNGKQESIITIKVEKDLSFTKVEDRYIYLPVVLWFQPAQSAKAICTKGSKLAIKGRICNEKGQGLKIISEKISFMDRYFHP